MKSPSIRTPVILTAVLSCLTMGMSLYVIACTGGADRSAIPTIECSEKIKEYISEIAFEKMNSDPENPHSRLFLFTAVQDIETGMNSEIRAQLYDADGISCGSAMFYVYGRVLAGEKGRASIILSPNEAGAVVIRIRLVHHDPWKTKKE